MWHWTVTIGIIVAPLPSTANPSVLFLDEPSTGLDSKAAESVMQHVAKIAEAGATGGLVFRLMNSQLCKVYNFTILIQYLL